MNEYVSKEYENNLRKIVQFNMEKIIDLEIEVDKLKKDNINIHEMMKDPQKWAFNNFNLEKNDILFNIPQHFVVEFMRNGVKMVAMQFLGGDIKHFKKSILDNAD